MNALPAVLMVDDSPVNLYALKAALDMGGVDLVRASSGAEALSLVLQREFALILMDVQMPGMDGYEAARLIRQREKSSRTPIIFVTANAPDNSRQLAGYAAGAVDYLFKPVDPTILRSKVQVFVDLYRHAELKIKAAAMEAANQQLQQDLAVQARLAEQLAHLTQHDLVTGLPNRQVLEQRLEAALAGTRQRGHGVALNLIDLDGFKHVIDTQGHAVGDALLQEAATRLRSLAQGEQFVARVAGSEFALVLPHLNGASSALAAARKVMEVLAEPFDCLKPPLTITASVGIAAAPQDGLDAISLLHRAGIALDQARSDGGNAWRYSRSGEGDAVSRPLPLK